MDEPPFPEEVETTRYANRYERDTTPGARGIHTHAPLMHESHRGKNEEEGERGR